MTEELTKEQVNGSFAEIFKQTDRKTWRRLRVKPDLLTIKEQPSKCL
jgi:hypothetical protein